MLARIDCTSALVHDGTGLVTVAAGMGCRLLLKTVSPLTCGDELLLPGEKGGRRALIPSGMTRLVTIGRVVLYSGGLVPVDHVPSTVEHSRTLKMEISMSFRNIVTKPNKIPVCIMKQPAYAFNLLSFPT